LYFILIIFLKKKVYITIKIILAFNIS